MKSKNMIDYIKGTIVDLTPAELILENNGIGYRILISLQTYQVLENKKEATVYIYHYLREDMELYYGFATTDERELFELLQDSTPFRMSGPGTVHSASSTTRSPSSEKAVRESGSVGQNHSGSTSSVPQ